MEISRISLLIVTLTAVISGTIVIAKELGKLNRNIKIMEENIQKDISLYICNLAWELAEQKKLIEKNN